MREKVGSGRQKPSSRDSKRGVAYVVNLTGRAARGLALIFDAIRAEYFIAALKWYLGLRKAILSLKEHPQRCPETPEDAKLRHLLYGHKPRVYRVIYRIIEAREQGDILHVRHGARPQFKRAELN